jgi:hypothetical protein
MLCDINSNIKQHVLPQRHPILMIGRVKINHSIFSYFVFSLWLGATDKRISLVYEYIDGTPFRFRNVQWLPGEPNRNPKLLYHHCLFMTSDGEKMGWGDDDCYMAFGYVCKGLGE